MEIEIVDNSEKTLEEFKAACLRALERCGSQAEGYAKDLVPVDTSNLQQHITHTVDESELAAYIGTNVDYAAYVELGTGKYYAGGTPRPWTYTDTQGKTHWTGGQKAKPYLKPAVADHAQTYRNIIEDELKNG